MTRDETDDEFDPAEFLPYLLNQAAEAAGQEFQAIYKQRYGMLRTEWRVLFHLGMYGRMTATEISRRASVHKTKVSRAVRQLTGRRFVTRERDGADRRFEYLELTTAGRAAYRDLRQEAERYDKQLTARLSTDEVAVLRRILKQLSARG